MPKRRVEMRTEELYVWYVIIVASLQSENDLEAESVSAKVLSKLDLQRYV